MERWREVRMKIHKVRIGKKAYNICFYISHKFFLLISLVLILESIYPGYASAQRKYSPMSTSEAHQHVKMIIEDKKVPSPLGGSILTPRTWKLPDKGIYARGIKFDDANYMVLAFVWPVHKIRIFKVDGLDEFLPETKTPIEFTENGLLFSTEDIEVVNLPLLIFSEKGWTKGNQVIEKGGYVWYIGPVGIGLARDAGYISLIIPFKDPIKDFAFNTMYEVEFSFLGGEKAGVLLKIAGGKDIQLR